MRETNSMHCLTKHCPSAIAKKRQLLYNSLQFVPFGGNIGAVLVVLQNWPTGITVLAKITTKSSEEVFVEINLF